jgi:hypothetical protein
MVDAEKKYPMYIVWAIFFALLIWQHHLRAEAWGYLTFNAFPEPLGSIVTAVFWLGSGPLAICFILLIPSNPLRSTLRNASFMTMTIAVIGPASNLIFSLHSTGQLLDLKTLLWNGLAMVLIAPPLFFVLTLLPKFLISKILKKD